MYNHAFFFLTGIKQLPNNSKHYSLLPMCKICFIRGQSAHSLVSSDLRGDVKLLLLWWFLSLETTHTSALQVKVWNQNIFHCIFSYVLLVLKPVIWTLMDVESQRDKERRKGKRLKRQTVNGQAISPPSDKADESSLHFLLFSAFTSSQ